jgi:anti-sigma regulatory factor (Ser/Thr protein kinase)
MILLDASLTNSAAAAHEARDLVAALTATLPRGTVDDLVLLVSELVTNSHRHARLSDGASIGLRVTRSKGAVRVEVTDPGDSALSPPRLRAPTGDGGWGLHIVDNVATRWGVEHRGTRTLVWFEIDLANGNRS